MDISHVPDEDLSKVLSSLAYSEYTIRSTIDLTNKMKNERIPKGFSMVSFDVKSLFALCLFKRP